MKATKTNNATKRIDVKSADVSEKEAMPKHLIYPGPQYQIWRCSDRDCTNPPIGFLVTEAGDVDRPIAFCPIIGDERDILENAMMAATKIARHPDESMDMIPWRCAQPIDLRGHCQLTSTSPMPRFVFELWCTPANAEGEEIDEVIMRQPRPFCIFALREMLAKHNALRWPDADRQAMPFDVVGIFKEDDPIQGPQEDNQLVSIQRHPDAKPRKDHAGPTQYEYDDADPLSGAMPPRKTGRKDSHAPRLTEQKPTTRRTTTRA